MIAPDKEATADFFQENNISYHSHIDTFRNTPIHGLTFGNKKADHVYLFLHGAPGSWKDYSEFYKNKDFVENNFIIVIDRPGYGQSDYGNAMPSILKQADYCKGILKPYSDKEIHLVGYSYGGPVAAVLSGMMGNEVSETILLAPVVHPEKERIFWFNHVIDFPLVYALMPRYIKASNDEKLNHEKALKESVHLIKQIQSPVLHIHSRDDWIAPYEDNVRYLRQHIPKEFYTHIAWEDKSHFLPNSQIDNLLPFFIKK